MNDKFRGGSVWRFSASVALAFFFLALLAPRRARAGESNDHFALVVGSNGGATLDRVELRYADDDAAKYAALLGSTAGGRVELLTRFDADSTRLFPRELAAAHPPTRAALDEAVARIVVQAAEAKAHGRDVVFTFVFAGHGDVEGGRGFLELEDGRFFREDLEAMIATVGATKTHVILDSCNSVYMLAARKPGGTRFATPAEVEQSMRARMANVGTFLSTSADAEVYEWSQIESGVFSHVVRSGLAGAADLDGDGRITYGELRAFARVAVESIPNARFRPRIFARGPGGRENEVLFEPRAAAPEGRYVLDAGTERRVTVLDENEVPLIDVRLESGFGTKIVLPARGKTSSFVLVEDEGRGAHRTTLAPAEDGHALVARLDVPPGPRARASRPFELLFSASFGPRAVAALSREAPDREVYGVSVEERERMWRLLDAARGFKRDERIGTGLVFSALGLELLSAGVAVLTIDRSQVSNPKVVNIVGGVSLGLGALGLGLGASKFLSRSDMEVRRDEFVATVHARPDAFDLAVRNAEQQLLDEAEAARRRRKALSYTVVGLGALFAGLGALGEIGAYQTHGADETFLHTESRFLIGAGLAVALTGVGTLFVRSEPERLWDLWTSEQSTYRASPSPSSLRVQPMVGLGALGLQGTF